MTLRLTLGIGLLALALPGFADEESHATFDIKIKTVEGAEEPLVIAFSSDDMGFEFDDMQVGENRSFTDDQGRNILVTREESGLKLDVDGKTVEIPHFGGLHGAGMIDVDVDTIVDRQVHVERIGPDGISIISDKQIDEATRQSIESVLRSAGYDDAVNFVDTSSAEKIHKVIRRQHKM